MNTGFTPGALMSLFGFGLPAVNPKMTFGGVAAKVLYASPNLINLQVPFQPGLPLGIQLALPAGNITLQTLPTDRSLGIFTADGIYAAALNQNGTVNAAANPAVAGSIVTLYGTGAIWPAGMIDGGVPVAAASLDQQQNGFQIVDGRGVPADIFYAGAAPQIINGVFQVNVLVPVGARPPFTLQSVPANTSGQATLSSNPFMIYTQ